MKRTMLMAAIAILISAALSAQNANQTRSQAGNREQNQVSTQQQAGVMNQTRTEYQNQGEVTKAQNQIRIEEKKAFKQQQKALKKQQKEMKKQESALKREQYREQEKTAVKNQGARTAAPMKNAAKVTRSAGPGRK